MFEVLKPLRIVFDGGPLDGRNRRVDRLPREILHEGVKYVPIASTCAGIGEPLVYHYEPVTDDAEQQHRRYQLFLEQLKLEALARRASARYQRAYERREKLRRRGQTKCHEFDQLGRDLDRLSFEANEAAIAAAMGPRVASASVASTIAGIMMAKLASSPNTERCTVCCRYVPNGTTHEGRCSVCLPSREF